MALKLVLAFAALSSASAAQAQTECRAGESEPRFSTADAALTEWQAEKQIAMTGQMRGLILARFCAAAVAVSREQGVEPGEIDRMSRGVLRDYLDANIGASERIAPLQERLTALFELNARPQPPEARAFGRIQVVYRRSVDALRVDAQPPLPPGPFIGAPIGRRDVSGWLGGQVVCRAVVNVIGGVTAIFNC